MLLEMIVNVKLLFFLNIGPLIKEINEIITSTVIEDPLNQNEFKLNLDNQFSKSELYKLIEETVIFF